MIKLLFVKLNNLLIYILSVLVTLLVGLYKRRNIPGTILLVRLDSIGDYILFRNFIYELKNNLKYKNHKITLCGNILWKELSETLDKDIIDEFIWVNRKKYYSNLLYKFNLYKTVYKKGFEVAIDPTYTREVLYGDFIIKNSCASERIGFCGSLEKHTKWKRIVFSDRYYTKLIETGKENYFEFYRNRLFFEKLLDTKLEISKPFIQTDCIKYENKIRTKYVVLFPGAAFSIRRWDINKFSEVAKYIVKKFSLAIVIAGGVNEFVLPEKLSKELGENNLFDMRGKTSLSQLVKLIEGSELLISNETGAVHIAAAVNKKTICISNGNHFGRFNPYPTAVFDGIYYLYPEIVTNKIREKSGLEEYRFDSELNINEISPEEVIKLINEFFDTFNN